jgi:hypothetical protein
MLPFGLSQLVTLPQAGKIRTVNFWPTPVTTPSGGSLSFMSRALALMLVTAVLPSGLSAQSDVVPPGWFKAGNAPQEYEVGTDESVRRTGEASAYVRARHAGAKGFGTLMQTVAADEYRGKRVRLSGFLRAVGASRQAGLWMRIDGPDRRQPLGFGNTQDRVVPGPDWKRAEIVLDVPAEATSINFGLLLSGDGQTWVDDLDLEEVSRDVPTTGQGMVLPPRPRNLDFERKRPPTSTSDGR